MTIHDFIHHFYSESGFSRLNEYKPVPQARSYTSTVCELKVKMFFFSKIKQEPITRSVQLPYSACETAFLQVKLFLDIKAFTQISSQ